MAKRKILTDNDPTLRTVCRAIPRITPRIETLLDDMIETMRDANGVGLAAPQVGVLLRAVVIETEPGEVWELINPEIIETSGEQEGSEGCLSLPGRSGHVKRPNYVKRERVYGAFSRSFDVSGINVEGIQAAYNDGILTLTMPKKVEQKPARCKLEIK